MVYEEDTTANGPAMGGLSRCVLKGTRTVLRGSRGSDAPNLPDLTKNVWSIHLKSKKTTFFGEGGSFFAFKQQGFKRIS